MSSASYPASTSSNALLFYCFVAMLLCVPIQSATVISGLTPSNPEVILTPTQTSSMTYYSLSYSASLSTMEYILVELTIDSATMNSLIVGGGALPMLCYEFDGSPVVSQNANGSLRQPCYNGYNLNQYARGNGQYSVLVQTAGITYSSITFGVFIDTTSITFDLRIRGRFTAMTKDVCAFDCSAGSSASANCLARTCTCSSGQIDYDCSQSSLELSADATTLHLTSSALQTVYYKSSLKINNIGDVSRMKVKFLSSSPLNAFEIYVNVEGKDPQIIVPTATTYYANFTTSQPQYVLSFKPQLLYDGLLQPRTITFALKTATSGQTLDVAITAQLNSTSEDGGMKPMILIAIIIAAVIGLFLLVWLVISVLKMRYAKQNRIHSDNQLFFAGQQLPGAAITQADNRLFVTESYNKLTVDVVDQYMPIMSYTQATNHLKEHNKSISEQCSVCLIEFTINDQCRTTVCQHAFHKNCLEQWLGKYENCPFCRTDLSREALIKHGNPDELDVVMKPTVLQQQMTMHTFRTQQPTGGLMTVFTTTTRNDEDVAFETIVPSNKKSTFADKKSIQMHHNTSLETKHQKHEARIQGLQVLYNKIKENPSMVPFANADAQPSPGGTETIIPRNDGSHLLQSNIQNTGIVEQLDL